MAESSSAHRTAVYLPEHQLMGVPLCVCSAAVYWGREVYRNEEKLRELPHCDMSDPSLQSLQHEQGKRHLRDSASMSSLWYRDFSWTCNVFPRCEEVAPPARSNPEVGELCIYRQHHRSWWPVCGYVVFQRCRLCLSEVSGWPNYQLSV